MSGEDVGLGNDGYRYSEAITVGGPTGDYFVRAPQAVSAKYVEYLVLVVATGDVAGASGIIVSGHSKPVQPNWVGAANTSLNDDTVTYNQTFRLAATITATPAPLNWIRVTNSEKKVFVRIDTQASNSVYVTIQFRARTLGIVPGPAPSVHPDYMQSMNEERSATVAERLKVMGIPGYAEEQDATKQVTRKAVPE